MDEVAVAQLRQRVADLQHRLCSSEEGREEMEGKMARQGVEQGARQQENEVRMGRGGTIGGRQENEESVCTKRVRNGENYRHYSLKWTIPKSRAG